MFNRSCRDLSPFTYPVMSKSQPDSNLKAVDAFQTLLKSVTFRVFINDSVFCVFCCCDTIL